jgi:hypothetical protein
VPDIKLSGLQPGKIGQAFIKGIPVAPKIIRKVQPSSNALQELLFVSNTLGNPSHVTFTGRRGAPGRIELDHIR